MTPDRGPSSSVGQKENHEMKMRNPAPLRPDRRRRGGVLRRHARLLLLGSAIAVAGLTASTSASAATPAWRLAAITGPTNLPPTTSEIQRLAIAAESGTFSLTFGPGASATPPIPAGATAAEVANALNDLSSIKAAGGSVEVSGGPGDAAAARPYFIRFVGSLAGTDVGELGVDGTALHGGGATATVSTQTQGGQPGEGTIKVFATNIGGAPSDGSTTELTVSLPPGLSIEAGAAGERWSCPPPGGGGQTISCTTAVQVPPGLNLAALMVPVTVSSRRPGSGVAHVAISGGGASAAAYSEPITISATPAGPGIQVFQAGSYDADGKPYVQAGGHPFSAGTAFLLNTVLSPSGAVIPAGLVREISIELPPGFLGNPQATPKCPVGETPVPEQVGSENGCLARSIVGTSGPLLQSFGGSGSGGGFGVYDNQAPAGFPAEFTFKTVVPKTSVVGALRSDGDYGLTVIAPNLFQLYRVYGDFFTFWGVPAGPAHDSARCEVMAGLSGCPASQSSDGARVPLLTALTSCAESVARPPAVTLHMGLWEAPQSISTSTAPQPSASGCDRLSFHPSFRFQAGSHQAAAPSPYTADLEIPQEGLTDPDRLAAPELRKAVVTLPEGVNVNPASANGLEACSEAQIGLTTTEGEPPNPIRFDRSEPRCPEASKLGTVEARSPLLEETLDGTIYLAAQEENPFDSLLALYLVIDSPRNGILVKLPGEVKPDLQTGQLTATFDNNPQLPVEDLTLRFRGGGPRSPLTTPAVCGTYTTHGEFTPWSAPESGPPAQTEDAFQVTAGPGGGPCATSEAGLPFSPGFEAGTTSTRAGAYAPLIIRLARNDGEQELTHLDFTLPPGLTGRLAGIPYCSDEAIAEAASKSGRAERQRPSCPAAAELGTVDTAAGVGPEPTHVGGRVYLAGPYEGAPLSSVVITPAVAGPFDLGDVVVRAPLFVNPETAQITARSDEIPHVLRGIPLQLRSVEIKVTRQGFTLNPTSCDPMTVSSSMSGLNGASAKPSSRFQVGGCRALRFKPNLKLRLKGATRRVGHPALKAVLTAKPGEANIGRAQVNLPRGEFLDQGNLNKTCTKPVLLAGNCPRSTVYGKAKAWTPLLEKPLEGNVYLVGGYGYKLPALVADLNGQIRILLVGKVDSGKNHGIRNTFEAVPDAPVSRFVLEMKGGKRYGLLENSESLCRAKKAKRRAIVRFRGQNGKVHRFKSMVKNQCGKHRHARRAGKRRSR